MEPFRGQVPHREKRSHTGSGVKGKGKNLRGERIKRKKGRGKKDGRE